MSHVFSPPFLSLLFFSLSLYPLRTRSGSKAEPTTRKPTAADRATQMRRGADHPARCVTAPAQQGLLVIHHDGGGVAGNNARPQRARMLIDRQREAAQRGLGTLSATCPGRLDGDAPKLFHS